MPGKDAVREGMVIGDDGIAVGDDAFTYSRRSSPPPPVSVSRFLSSVYGGMLIPGEDV